MTAAVSMVALGWVSWEMVLIGALGGCSLPSSQPPDLFMESGNWVVCMNFYMGLPGSNPQETQGLHRLPVRHAANIYGTL